VETKVLRGHKNSVNSVAFSPDGATIVSASGGGEDYPHGERDFTVRLWDLRTGAEVAVMRGHYDKVFSVAFSADGDRIVSGGDRTVRLWDAGSGVELAVLKGPEDRVLSVAFSPAADRIVSASGDKTLRLWDARIGAQSVVLRGHQGSHVSSLAFSPNGDRIVSGGPDSTVRVWDARSGAEVAVLRGHQEWVFRVAFSPDGQRIVSQSYDKTVRVWDAESEECREVISGSEEVAASEVVIGEWYDCTPDVRGANGQTETLLVREGMPIAMLPLRLSPIANVPRCRRYYVARPGGGIVAEHSPSHTVAGAVCEHVCIFGLEGAATIAAYGVSGVAHAKRRVIARPREFGDAFHVVFLGWIASTIIAVSLTLAHTDTSLSHLLAIPLYTAALLYPLFCIRVHRFVPFLTKEHTLRFAVLGLDATGEKVQRVLFSDPATERSVAVAAMWFMPVIMAAFAGVLWPIDWLWTRLLGPVIVTTYPLLAAKVVLIEVVRRWLLVTVAIRKADAIGSSRDVSAWGMRAVATVMLLLLIAPALISAAILALWAISAMIVAAAKVGLALKRTKG
jgi:predicted NACHT family NTPase